METSKWRPIRNFIIGTFFTLVCLYPIFFAFTAKKHVHSYRLSSWYGNDHRVDIFPAIYVDVENGPDDYIYLPSTTSFQSAVHMVDSMNAQLIKLKQANGN